MSVLKIISRVEFDRLLIMSWKTLVKLCETVSGVISVNVEVLYNWKGSLIMYAAFPHWVSEA